MHIAFLIDERVLFVIKRLEGGRHSLCRPRTRQLFISGHSRSPFIRFYGIILFNSTCISLDGNLGQIHQPLTFFVIIIHRVHPHSRKASRNHRRRPVERTQDRWNNFHAFSVSRDDCVGVAGMEGKRPFVPTDGAVCSFSVNNINKH